MRKRQASPPPSERGAKRARIAEPYGHSAHAPTASKSRGRRKVCVQGQEQAEGDQMQEQYTSLGMNTHDGSGTVSRGRRVKAQHSSTGQTGTTPQPPQAPPIQNIGTMDGHVYPSPQDQYRPSYAPTLRSTGSALGLFTPNGRHEQFGNLPVPGLLCQALAPAYNAQPFASIVSAKAGSGSSTISHLQVPTMQAPPPMAPQPLPAAPSSAQSPATQAKIAQFAATMQPPQMPAVTSNPQIATTAPGIAAPTQLQASSQPPAANAQYVAPNQAPALAQLPPTTQAAAAATVPQVAPRIVAKNETEAGYRASGYNVDLDAAGAIDIEAKLPQCSLGAVEALTFSPTTRSAQNSSCVCLVRD